MLHVPMSTLGSTPEPPRMTRRTTLTRTILSVTAIGALTALTGCSRFNAERAFCAHEHVHVSAQPIAVADVPLDD